MTRDEIRYELCAENRDRYVLDVLNGPKRERDAIGVMDLDVMLDDVLGVTVEVE